MNMETICTNALAEKNLSFTGLSNNNAYTVCPYVSWMQKARFFSFVFLLTSSWVPSCDSANASVAEPTVKKAPASEASAEVNKQSVDLLNPIRTKAKDFRSTLEHYKKSLQQRKKNKMEEKSEALLKEADDKTKAFEDASQLHDTLMEQYRKGKINSGKEAIQLSETILGQEQTIKELFWRLNQMIDLETPKQENVLPSVQKDELPMHPRSIPAPPSRFPPLPEPVFEKKNEQDMYVEETSNRGVITLTKDQDEEDAILK